MSEQNRWVTAYFRRYSTYLKIFLIFLSVAIPLAVLYSLYPASFDKTFNGRAYYLFFIWLVVLEFALDWDKYKLETSKMDVKRTFAFGLALTLPTCYVIVSNFFGLNAAIRELTRLSGILSPSLADYADRLNFTPLATEFLVFAVLFAVIILCAYRLKGLTDFSLPIAFVYDKSSGSFVSALSDSCAHNCPVISKRSWFYGLSYTVNARSRFHASLVCTRHRIWDDMGCSNSLALCWSGKPDAVHDHNVVVFEKIRYSSAS